ncbi:TPA: HAD-IIB family hydrolase, partial [Streptococcus agalactiae]|nr:HAD-IIB family hydrolase [Streptococcus agalactiae]
MAIKAVFFDIDGTLLNDRKNVQKSTIKAIRNLKDQGILVGLATGRGPSFVQPFLENLGLDFAVTYNGQYIYSRSEIIYTNQLSKTTVYRLIRYAGARRREISLGTASGLLGSGIIGLGTSRLGQIVSSLVPRKWAKAIERSFKHFIRRIKPQNIDSLMVILREPIYQVVLVATEGESERIQKQFPRVKLTRSSPYSMDVISEGQSKVKGIERVGQRYGFDLSEVIAFGDS